MLKARLTPSRLIDPATRGAVRIIPTTEPPRSRGLRTMRHFRKFLADILRLFLKRQLTTASYAQRFRRLLEEMGGLWLKAGQLLSYRIDIFSSEFCRELSWLQAQAAGFPSDVARRIIEEELGAPIEQYFDQFEDVPFAAASIGQIHRARLREEGVWVAVKVQRPFLEETFTQDLRVIERLVRFLRFVSYQQHMRWEEGMRELRTIMREELDCRYEASAFVRMRKSLRKHGIYVPKVFRRYTRKRIVVTEFIHATLMADYITMADKDPAKLADWLAENNIKPRVVARRLIQSIYRQVFEDNLYHGDLHPGNIILLRNSRIALIDFGAIAFTELEYLQRARLVFSALATRDYSKAADTALLLGGKLRALEIELVKRELIEALRDWGTRMAVSDLPYHDRSLDSSFVVMTRIMTQHRCEVKWALLRMRRANAALDASIVALYPEVDTHKQVEIYMSRAGRRAATKGVRQMYSNMIGGMTMGMQVTTAAWESAVYQGSSIRRQAQVFEATTSKFAYLFAVFFAQLALLESLAAFLFVVAFLQQYYPTWVSPWVWQRLAELAQRFPRLDYPVWMAVLTVTAFFLTTSLKLARRFAEKEAAMSENNARM